MSGDIKTVSLDSEMQRLMPITNVLRHLSTEPATSTAVKSLVKERPEFGEATRHDTYLVRFIGTMFFEHEGSAPAVARLLNFVDQALVHGDPERNPLEFPGLISLAKRNQEDFGRQQVYTDPREFFDRFERERKEHNLRVMSHTSAKSVDEGDLPGGETVIAMAPGALKWAQLMPMMRMPLVSMREGRFTKSITGDPVEPFNHIDSITIHRTCALLYGTTKVIDPDGFFVLTQG